MTQWSATIEYPGTLTARTAASGVAVTVHADRGRTAVSFGVQADTLPLAVDAALRQAGELVDGVLAAQPVSLHVLTDDTVAADVERPAVPELVDAADAREILGGISQQRLYQLQHTADFPKPVQRFGGGRGVWVKAAIEEYAGKDRKPGRPRKTPEE